MRSVVLVVEAQDVRHYVCRRAVQVRVCARHAGGQHALGQDDAAHRGHLVQYEPHERLVAGRLRVEQRPHADDDHEEHEQDVHEERHAVGLTRRGHVLRGERAVPEDGVRHGADKAGDEARGDGDGLFREQVPFRRVDLGHALPEPCHVEVEQAQAEEDDHRREHHLDGAVHGVGVDDRFQAAADRIEHEHDAHHDDRDAVVDAEHLLQHVGQAHDLRARPHDVGHERRDAAHAADVAVAAEEVSRHEVRHRQVLEASEVGRQQETHDEPAAEALAEPQPVGVDALERPAASLPDEVPGAAEAGPCSQEQQDPADFLAADEVVLGVGGSAARAQAYPEANREVGNHEHRRDDRLGCSHNAPPFLRLACLKIIIYTVFISDPVRQFRRADCASRASSSSGR